jgi:hypothetical protein
MGGKREGSQVKLYSVAHAIVLQRQLVLERTFALALQHDFVGFATDSGCHLGLEELCRERSMSIFGR